MSASEISAGAWMAFAQLAGPILAAMLVIGLVAGMLQTMTQIREASISFVLKLAALAFLLTTAGPLMMRGLQEYTVALINAIPEILHG